MSDATSGAGLDATLRDFSGGQKVFGRYTLIRTLGRGGMGIVWLAKDEVLEREVALKFVPDIVVLDPGVLSDLRRETKRSLELTHKNIVRIYDFVHDADSACISMEYIDGGTLSGLRVEKEPKIFEANEIADWIAQACDALDYAHNHARIIHRDLKPSNLMVNKRGELKVADFGIARSLSDSVSMLTHARGTSGTLVYMSPQQLDGERGTHLDDIYSLGATIYELLTSKPPFYSGNIDRQTREKIACSMAQRRRELEIDGNPIAKNWEEVVAACLAKDPAKRPQSVREVAQRLGGATPQPIAITREPKKRKTRRSLLAIAGTAVVIAAVALGVFFLRPKPQQSALPAGTPKPESIAANIRAATKDHPFENNLGMKFVPVSGTNVLFSIWDTRVQDYDAFVKGTGQKWERPNFEQGPTHPAVRVSWEDAKAFCQWLTKNERDSGRLSAEQEYRLPTDAEWSVAVGLPPESGDTPEAKDFKIKDYYPWGKQWPPSQGAGNYDQNLHVDRYDYTSPVGSFSPNKFGLYDMGGNVWQWCVDKYTPGEAHRVLRGASWNDGVPEGLLSSYRVSGTADLRNDYSGFRCVLVVESSP